MEYLNRIELRGIVGRVSIRQIGNISLAELSLMTDYAYRDSSGNGVIETTWFSITAFEGKKNCQLERLEKGITVYVVGRLRIRRYTGADGLERSFPEIVANELRVER